MTTATFHSVTEAEDAILKKAQEVAAIEAAIAALMTEESPVPSLYSKYSKDTSDMYLERTPSPISSVTQDLAGLNTLGASITAPVTMAETAMLKKFEHEFPDFEIEAIDGDFPGIPGSPVLDRFLPPLIMSLDDTLESDAESPRHKTDAVGAGAGAAAAATEVPVTAGAKEESIEADFVHVEIAVNVEVATDEGEDEDEDLDEEEDNGFFLDDMSLFDAKLCPSVAPTFPEMADSVAIAALPAVPEYRPKIGDSPESMRRHVLVVHGTGQTTIHEMLANPEMMREKSPMHESMYLAGAEVRTYPGMHFSATHGGHPTHGHGHSHGMAHSHAHGYGHGHGHAATHLHPGMVVERDSLPGQSVMYTPEMHVTSPRMMHHTQAGAVYHSPRAGAPATPRHWMMSPPAAVAPTKRFPHTPEAIAADCAKTHGSGPSAIVYGAPAPPQERLPKKGPTLRRRPPRPKGTVPPPPMNYTCHRCKEKGHWIEDCDRPRKIGPPPRHYVCHRCHCRGHWIEDCGKTTALRTELYLLPPATYICKLCGNGGHWVHDCHLA